MLPRHSLGLVLHRLKTNMPRKAFTVDEANAMIPRLSRVFAQIAEHKHAAHTHHEQLQVLQVLWGDELTRPTNPDHQEYREHKQAIEGAVAAIEGLVQREILEYGLRFPQGGLESGLVDFPTLYEGRWVYLCWQTGESRIVAWHEVDAGFQGRQPLTREHARRMGVEDNPYSVDDSVLDF
jgi:hypothetical protein